MQKCNFGLYEHHNYKSLFFRKYKQSVRAKPRIRARDVDLICKTLENSKILKNDKMVILVKIQNFSRSRMTKWTSPLEPSREI